jgi:hypothetical protein
MKSPKVNQAEDKILDEYLAGKSHLSDTYKNIEMDLPGVDVDSAILAASRREVGARPKPLGAEGWRKWQVPFSIAALLVVSASLTLIMTDHEKKADQVLLASAPLIVTEESKPSRGDGFGQGAAGSVESNKAAATPARKLEPIERAKQKMASAQTPEIKTPEPKLAQAMKAPAPVIASASGRADAKPQAFPPTAAKNREGDAQTANKLATVDSARAPQAAVIPAAPAPAAAVTVIAAEANEADKASPSVAAAPAPAAVASAPVMASAQSESTPQARSARAAVTASAAAPTENVRDAAGAQTLRKSGQLSEAEIVAAYSASQTWLAKIEALLREGKTEEAERALAEFKNRFPNYVTPESIKEELARQRAVLNAEPK